MKKVIKLFIVFIGIIFISGCSVNLPNKKISICTLENDQSKSGYKVSSTYKIYSKNDIVTKVNTEEILTSKNTTIIKYFEDLINKQYKELNNTYGGYTYNIKKDNDKIISTVNIDYSKMNLEKFINDNSAMKAYINKDKKMTLKGIQTMYESLGAKCK